MICYKCKELFEGEGWEFDSEKGFSHSPSCPSKAIAAQPCPPSTTGSASAAPELRESKCVTESEHAQNLDGKKAGDEHGVDNAEL